MSETARLINAVYSNFRNSATVNHHSTIKQSDAINWAIRTTSRARKLLRNDVQVQDAVELATALGKCYSAIGETHKADFLNEVRSLLAQAIGRMLAPNRDECRRRASEEFSQLYEDELKQSHKGNAAIALTNSALLLLELANPTKEELEEAERSCQRSLAMRAKGTIDYAYAEMNLSLAKRKNISRLIDHDKPVAFQDILHGLDRSRKVFDRLGVDQSEYEFEYQHNVIETLQDWLEFEMRQERKRRDEGSYHHCKGMAEALGISPDIYVAALRSNPEVVGCSEVPAWLPKESEICGKAIERVPGLRDRIQKCYEFLDAESGRYPELEIKAFDLRVAMFHADGVPTIPWSALDAIWDKGDRELYFIKASRIVSWCGMSTGSMPKCYPRLLLRFEVCINHFRDKWRSEDVRRLLERNPVTFRFVACELARLSMWEDAFNLLEASRGINSTQTWKSRPQVVSSIRDCHTWVHVTHSPRASYVIMKRDDKFLGREFPELSGKSLVPLFVNFVTGGLQRRLKDSREHASIAAVKISEKITPLANWIRDNSCESVVIMEGGFYQGFPVWACGYLASDFVSGQRMIVSSPSRFLALRDREDPSVRECPDSLYFVEASSVPGMAELSYGKREQTSIQESFGPVLEVYSQSATPGVLKQVLMGGGIVHYSGHSRAAHDPLHSAILTYSDDFTVSDMLKIPIGSHLVCFASCESAMSLNALHQDEYLSMQSAAFYAGARMVVGTNWPVADLTAFVFSSAFYRSLGDSVGVSLDGPFDQYVVSAFRSAVSTVFHFTATDLEQLLGCSVVGSICGDSRIFGFYDWAAFKLLGVGSV